MIDINIVACAQGGPLHPPADSNPRPVRVSVCQSWWPVRDCQGRLNLEVGVRWPGWLAEGENKQVAAE